MVLPDLVPEAERLLSDLRARGLKLATAESCTGGLIAALFTEVAGASDVFERGFVTYTNAAKIGQLGVDLEILLRHGAVSAQTAEAMADGALRCSAADVALIVRTSENTDIYTPTTSRLAALVVVDLLATGVALRRPPEQLESVREMKRRLAAMRHRPLA